MVDGVFDFRQDCDLDSRSADAWAWMICLLRNKNQSFCAGQSKVVPLVPFWLKYQGHLENETVFLVPYLFSPRGPRCFLLRVLL